MRRLEQKILPKFLLISMILLCSGCFSLASRRVPKTPQPLPVPIEDLLLQEEDLPPPTMGSKWWMYVYNPADDDWDWSVPVESASVSFGDNANLARIEQVIVRFADTRDAAEIWTTMKNARILHAMFEYTIISLLSTDRLATLHADDLLVRCEDYGVEAGPPECIVRLRYGPVYMQIVNTMSVEKAIGPEAFYRIIEAADKRMRPLWDR